MMNLTEVQRAARVLEALLYGATLQRVVQPDGHRLILEFYRSGKGCLILLSCHPKYARISLLNEIPKAPSVTPAFVQYLRAHFGRARFERASASAQDRRLGIRVNARGKILEISLSILGNRSNIYLLDPDGVLLFFMRPLTDTRRELVVGRPWVDPAGGPRSAGVDRWASVADAQYLMAVETAYAALETREQAEALAHRLENSLHREADFLARKAGNLLEDLGEAARAEEYRRRGELLKLAFHSIHAGDDSATVTNYETGAAVVIPLDSRLTPAQNLAAYFRRYQKELRGAGMLRQQLENLRGAQGALAVFQQRLKDLSASDLTGLRAFAAEPAVRRLLARYYPERKPRVERLPLKTPGSREIPARLLPRRYRTDQGLEIWVGRSEEGNDYLTTRLARGNDLFFHLEGYAGSHVILRAAAKSTPPAESILAACELAVHFSKLKEARHADVHVAPVKNVRKPKGAKPGLVYVTGGKTIHLRRDPKRLENILAARLEV